MHKRTLAILVAIPLLGAGCSQIRAKQAFKDGNKAYKEENFKKAIEEYGKAVEHDPSLGAGWFYLGSSHQALYRPGKEDASNKEHLDKAIEYYNKAIEVLQAANPQTPQTKQVKLNAFGALTGIYSDDPYRNFDKAYGYAQQLVQEAPDDPKNLYAMANLYEKFGKIDDAEKTYRRVFEQHPSDPKACGALAGFLNKPLWDETGVVWVEGSDKARRSKFDEAIGFLIKCADITPTDPSGYHKVATFFWDKGFRDPSLNEQQKLDYANRGLEYVDKALAAKPDYFEAIIYKGLLFRLKSTVTANPRERQRLIDEAIALQKQGLELKKAQAAAAADAAAAAAAATPAEGEGH